MRTVFAWNEGSKEDLLLSNITFEVILKETSQLDDSKVRMTSRDGERCELSHLEYVDDLCVIAPAIVAATKTMEKLVATLQKHDMILRKMSEIKYLGTIIGSTGESDEAIRENIAKALRSLIRLRPILISRNLTVQSKVRLIKLLIEPIATYGLPAIALKAKGLQ